MKSFMDLCLQRQSCRKFSDKLVEREKLEHCVEAARLCPSACNSQPWSFVVVETPELVAEVAKCGQQMNINAFLAGAKAFILVLEEHAVLMPQIRCILESQYFAKNDLGGAALTTCLAATSQGLGSCIIGMYDREKLCQLLSLPASQRFAALIAIGYPHDDAKLRAKSRKALGDIARFV